MLLTAHSTAHEQCDTALAHCTNNKKKWLMRITFERTCTHCTAAPARPRPCMTHTTAAARRWTTKNIFRVCPREKEDWELNRRKQCKSNAGGFCGATVCETLPFAPLGNLELELLAVLQVTHLIGTGSSANYIQTFSWGCGLDGYIPEMERMLEQFQRNSSRAVSTQQLHGTHLGLAWPKWNLDWYQWKHQCS